MEGASVPVWAFMALLGLLNLFLGAMLHRLWQSVDENTRAVSALREILPSVYATKEELRRTEDYARKQSHELANDIQGIGNRVTVLESSQ